MKFAIALLSFVFAIDMLAQSKPAADLIITNAKIWTGDKAHPTAQAVAVIGDRIVAVGSNSDVQILRGSATKTIDARGKLLLPVAKGQARKQIPKDQARMKDLLESH